MKKGGFIVEIVLEICVIWINVIDIYMFYLLKEYGRIVRRDIVFYLGYKEILWCW